MAPPNASACLVKLEYLETDTCEQKLPVKYLECLQMEACVGCDVWSMVNGTSLDSQYGANV